MKHKSSLLLLLLAVVFTANAFAQDRPETAAESLEKLRAQLVEVQAKEEGLRARAQQLEESIKPENIERSLAGVGSTKPEELRESRRRQLAIERDGVLAQLKLLETSRQRLETAIANAETRAYQQSARPAPTAETQMLSASTGTSYRWLLLGGGGAAALALAGGVLFYRRRIKLR
jgi:LPXTG-motif cell wall-anchored protein